MSDSGTFRYPGNLDPTAQEFIPGNPNPNPNPIPLFARITPTNVYISYGSPPFPSFPPLPVPPPSSYPSNDLRFLPLYPPPPLEYSPGSDAVEPYLRVAPAPLLPPTSVAPTRALVLISVAGDISESTVRRDLEVFGEVRGVQMERVDEGIVTVHFYDLRHAQAALKEIREQHMQQQLRFRTQIMGLNDVNVYQAVATGAPGLVSGRAVWAHFVIPANNAVPDGNNQGTLVILNLEPTVSSCSLRQIFQAYGAVKELRETPFKRHQRFVEFYDVRDAARALRDMNGKEIQGKPVVIQFSRPGGLSKRLFLSSHHHKNLVVNRSPPSPPPRELSGHSFSAVSPPSPLGRQSPGQFSARKPGNSRRGSTVVSVAALSLGNSPQQGTKNAKKSQSSHQPYKQHRNNNGKALKNKHMKKHRDACFVISEDAITDSSSCRDDRTTIMIKNIPNKYSQKLLLNMLDNHCIHYNEEIARQGNADDLPLSSYDFVYLPIDFNNKCNVGYGFVNMTSPQAAWRLYKAFHRQHWEVFNSRKICEVTYARVQGLEALKEHFKNSKFPCETEQYMPVVFSPPRDGRQLTEPVPIVDLARSVPSGHLESSDDDDNRQNIDGADGSCPPDRHDKDKPLGRCDGGCCGGGNGWQNGGVLDHEDDDDDDGNSSCINNGMA